MNPHVHINFISNVLYFCPLQNTEGFNIVVRRIILVLFNVDVSSTHFALKIGLPIIALGIVLFGCLYFAYFSKKYHRFIYCSLIFSVSGIICGLTDEIFLGGSIDYIGLFDWFVFDLKDVYLSVYSAFMVLIAIRYLRDCYKLSKEERKRRDKGFLAWIKKGCLLDQCGE
jgi:signal peptidase II